MVALLFVFPMTFAFGVLWGCYLHQLFGYEREFHQSDWIRDGRPLLYWNPFEGGLGGLLAGQICLIAWFLTTPQWMREDKQAHSLVKWYRWFFGLFTFGFLISFLLLIVSPK